MVGSVRPERLGRPRQIQYIVKYSHCQRRVRLLLCAPHWTSGDGKGYNVWVKCADEGHHEGHHEP